MFNGSIVALVTPMNINGDIDIKSFKRLIFYHIQNNTSAIVVAGTTGELHSLSFKEYKKILLYAIKYSKNKIPIIAGIGYNSTFKTINVLKKINKIGVSGYLCIVPYFNIPTQIGLIKHFKMFSSFTDLPIIIYNVPQRTGCNMLPDTVIRLSKIDNIIGIKDATGNLNTVNFISNHTKSNFFLFSGDDQSFLDFMQLGGVGVISVTANIVARQMSMICKLALSGNFVKARKYNEKIQILHSVLFYESNPIPIKWACKYLKMISSSYIRLPMTKLTQKNQKLLKEIFINFSFF